MTPTNRYAPRLWAAVALLLLGASVAAAPPPEDAGWLCAAGGGSSLAASSRQLTKDTRLFQASFVKSSWIGGLTAYAVNADGTKGAKQWNAADTGKIPAAAQRSVFTASSATVGIDFTWTALQKAGLDSWVVDSDTLDYLRGEQAGEVANGGKFRNRAARLGAIVNSEIAYAGVENFGYEGLAGQAGPDYKTFMQTKVSRTKLVIVGANDGMLHGFDAASGEEKFAYVPRALLLDPIDPNPPQGVSKVSTLVRLADPGFTPRYYVDGSPWVGDAYWSGAWRTVVVSTAGAGGKGVFALDITAPSTMTAGKVLWDLDGQGDSDLGYAFGQPVIGLLKDDKTGDLEFYAIFGNGRESQNQCPVLFLVRLRDGQVRKIAADPKACGANGLGRPSLYDIDPPGAAGYRTTDFVYAGDLKGNVWRFDLRKVDLSANPPKGADFQLVFAAVNGSSQAQPITGAIEIGAAPSGVAGNPTPAMLWFGTGRYFTDSDRTDATVQSMYGFVDRFAGGGKPDVAKVLRSGLQGQTVNIAGAAAGTITGTKVDYLTQDGWYADLPRSGERMVGMPLIQAGRLFFSTLIPDAAAMSCMGSGTSSIFAVDPYNGLSLAKQVFVNFPGKDFIASTVGIIRSLVGIDADTKAYLYAGGVGNAGSTLQTEEIRPQSAAGPRGRVSWREIVK